MIDLHCHILPGIDDGAKDLAEALALARHAVNAGISHAILTPHMHFERYENDKITIKSSFDYFQQKLKQEQIPLQIGFAAEVRIDPKIVDWVIEGRVPFLGCQDAKQLILLELPHSCIPAGTDNMIKWLIAHNIVPVIAHPERNKAIMKDPVKIDSLYNLGCLFQLTAGAVAGWFGEACTVTAVKLLKKNMVTFLASDTHNLKYRPPELEPGRRAAEKIIGESASWDLVKTNPKTVTAMHFEEYDRNEI